MTTDFKMLINEATDKLSTDYFLSDPYLNSEIDFTEGASLPNELLIKALEALEYIEAENTDQHYETKKDYQLSAFIQNKLAEICQRLEEATR